MVNRISLSGLKELVRRRGEWRSGYITDQMIQDWANDAMYKFVAMMSEIDPQRYLKTAVIQIISGRNSIDLPSDFWKAHSVAAPYNDGYYVLDQFDWTERWTTRSTDSPSEERRNLRWTITGGADDTGANTYDGYYNLRFDRAPQFNGNGLIDYFPIIPALEGDADEFDVINGVGLEWLLSDICIKACAKEESDPTIWANLKQEAQALLTSGIGRLTTPPKTVPSSTSGTLGDLIQAVRTRGPWKREDFTDTALTEWINSSAASLYDLIVDTDPTYFLSTTYYAVGAGDGSVALPADFYKAVQVYAEADGYHVLETFNWEERFDAGRQNTEITEARWQIRGDYLYLQPVPAWSGTLKLDYIPLMTRLTDTDESFGFTDNAWQELIILDASAKAAVATGIDPAPWAQQRAEVAARIKASAMREIEERKTSSSAGTLIGLIRSVRTRGQWPREMFSDAQVTEWVNSSIAAFSDLLFEYDPTQFLTRADISVVAGQAEYDLPNNFYRLFGVAVEDSSQPDGYAVMERAQWDERYDYNIVQTKDTARYLIVGNVIRFHPTPGWTGTVRLEYMAKFTPLSGLSDELTFSRNSWQEWIVLDACVKAAMAAGTDPQQYLAQRAEQERRIMKAAPRDIARPKTVVDVWRRNRYSRELDGWRRRRW